MSFHDVIGVDLGGAKGKTTALVHLKVDSAAGENSSENPSAQVAAVWSRHPEGEPWTDEALLRFLSDFPAANTVVAIGAPLTQPACSRCTLASCPGVQACPDQATQWLLSEGRAQQEAHRQADRERIASVPSSTKGFRIEESPRIEIALPPYTHRCTEVDLHFRRGLLPKESLGQQCWAVSSRAKHLRARLAQLGLLLNENLLEVSPRATVHALCGSRKARRYKREADPWTTRASILEKLKALSFSPESRFGREKVLANDHCFDALIAAFTGYLAKAEEWEGPLSPFAEDGWIWAPPESG